MLEGGGGRGAYNEGRTLRKAQGLFSTSTGNHKLSFNGLHEAAHFKSTHFIIEAKVEGVCCLLPAVQSSVHSMTQAPSFLGVNMLPALYLLQCNDVSNRNHFGPFCVAR